VPHLAAEHCHSLTSIVRGVSSKVHGGVEVAPGEQAGKVRRNAVAVQAFDALAEGVRQASAVEGGDLVAGEQQTPDQLVANKARAADHEDMHDSIPFLERPPRACYGSPWVVV